jgi:uncharacterized membrane protein YhfC
MLTAAYIFSFVGMVALPLVLWIHVRRKFALPWKLVLAGALTFIASQILHVPLVISMGSFLQRVPLLVNAILLGLMAGAFEETARYILFKLVLKNSRTWKEGVLVGLGHGGIESLLLGLIAAGTFVTMIGYRNIDLSTVPSIPVDQLELARQQVAAYWSAPWYMALLGVVERVFAITLHVSLSVMVLYAIASRKPVWFWLAFGWHALVDALAVYVVGQAGLLAVEGIVAVFAIVSLWISLSLRKKFKEEDASSTIQIAGAPTS